MGPAHFEQAYGIVEAAQHNLAAVAEHEPLTLGEVADDVCDEDLVRLRQSGDAGGPDDGCTEQVLVLRDRFSGVEAYADADGLGANASIRSC